MTTIVKTAHAKDFLALVPQLVGFQPSESIVFVAFRGSRTCAAVRFDLPDDSSEQHHRRVATSLVGMLSKLPGVDGVVPVVYTERAYLGDGGDSGAPSADPGPPHRRFVGAVIERFRFSGYRVRDALCVAGDAWGSYIDPDFPAEGRPLGDIAASEALGEVPQLARSRFGDVAQWAALPVVDLATKERVARKLRELARAFDSGRTAAPAATHDHADVTEAALAAADTALVDAEADFAAAEADVAAAEADVALALGLDDPARVHDLPAVLELILAHDVARLDDRAAAFVIAIARSPALRDVVMLQWAFDLATGDRVLDDAESFAAGAPAEDLDSGVLMLGQGPRPDPERVDAAIELLKAIAARAPRPDRPPLLCMLAWLNWALGRSSVAHLFVTAAQEIDDRYGLAELIRTVLDRGMLPEWAFAVE
jgi:hypothetical protein